MDNLKIGYTTGSCVASGIKAGLDYFFYGKKLEKITIKALDGSTLEIPVEKIKISKNSITVGIKKYSGDDPDVTNGILICVKIREIDEIKDFKNSILIENSIICGGRGVGKVTKKGLQVEVGKPAINKGPQKMIEEILKEYKEYSKKFKIIIYIPQGKEIAKRTFNQKFGVIGGLSILGSTGIVKPMSEEALKKSLFVELNVLKETKKTDGVIFTFGNYSKNYCEKMGIDVEKSIIISNYVGFMIDSAIKLGFKKIVLLGHIAKAIKVAGGIFNTHSKVADGRLEIFGANAFLFGEKNEVIKKILSSNTVEEAVEYIENKEFFNFLAEKIRMKMEEYGHQEIKCQVLLFSFKGETLGNSRELSKFLEEI